jgi:ParB/RepB/Spo0J family partition protein
LIADIPLDSIRPNPYNSRLAYTGSSIEKLSASISDKGQLTIIKVRPHPLQKGLYQLVFGHRRYYAAKKLGWKSITAEVVDTSDEDMIEESLVENFERENISDYELAMVFQRMNLEFHKTYDQIGKKIGVSRQMISNHIAMLRLFDSEELSSDPELARSLGQLTEHHARVLARVQDRSARRDLAKMIVRKNLSVRELTHIVTHLRSWFQEGKDPDRKVVTISGDAKNPEETRDEISLIIEDYLKFAHAGNSDAFMKLHFFGEGFSMYDDVPPYKRLNRDLALSKKKEWVSSVAPELEFQICDLKIDDLGSTAVVTLAVLYEGQLAGQYVEFKVRGTLVLVDKGGSWKIVHEHWSRAGEDEKRKIAIRSAIINMQKQN